MSVVWSIWLIYVLAALVASAIAISIGWRSHVAAGERGGHADHLTDMSSPSPSDETGTISDAAVVIKATARRMRADVQRQRAHLEIAAQPDLFVRLRPSLLAEFTEELIALGLHGAEGGHLLLTATRSGERIDIVLSDDQPVGDDASARQGQARHLAQRVALHGGSLDVVAQPNLGTTMTLKLAVATDRPAIMTETRMPAHHGA